MKISLLAFVLTALLCSSPVQAIPITDIVIVDGTEWAQVDDFLGLSWNAIDAVCPLWICSGTLTSSTGTWQMDGWSWAGVDEVNALFNVYLAAAGVAGADLLVGPDYYEEPFVSFWATAFIADFGVTNVFPETGVAIAGWTSDEATSSDGYYAVLSARKGLSDSPDSASTGNFAGKTLSSPANGGWFFREVASSVPLPSTALLMGLGLLGLGLIRPRRVA
jgi:hypothetical protein